jgi:Ca2+-dependent lipid-binding protein
VKFGGNPPIKTEVIKNTYDPTWNEALHVPVTTPTLTDHIMVEVYDYDTVRLEEFQY